MSARPGAPDHRVASALGLEFMIALGRHYAARPPGHAALYEAAQALAATAAAVLVAAGSEEVKGLRAYFDIAVDDEVADMLRRCGAPPTRDEAP